MKATARLTLTFRDTDDARAIVASVSPDDESYIQTTRRGRTVVAKADADSPMTLLHTLDDYLACISVAERTAEAARPRGRARRGRA